MGRRSQEAKTCQKGGLEAICAYYSSDLPGNKTTIIEMKLYLFWIKSLKMKNIIPMELFII